MKKLRKITLVMLAALGLASCVDTDKYHANPNYLYEQYKVAFEKEFGAIPEDQSWDFYAQLVGNTTRAASDVTVDNTIGQPEGMDFTEWQTMLVSGHDNRNVGTHQYSLISPANGKFKMYAVWYAGWVEAYADYEMEFGVKIGTDKVKLFDGQGQTGAHSNKISDYSKNPGFGADIYIPGGTKFAFYLRYKEGGQYKEVYSDADNSTVLYSDQVSADKQVMVIGFEDKLKDTWHIAGNTPDFNDIVMYIEGNPDLPVPEAKRFMCEDLGSIGDFDFNDVVFDVKPTAETGKAQVIVRAAGGTLPAVLWVAGQKIGEVHELLGESTTTMINTGYGASKEQYATTIDVPAGFDLASFKDFKVVITDKNGERDVVYQEGNTAPCVLITPISLGWMKETINIKKAYPNFFQNDWVTSARVKEYLYGN